VRAPRRLGIGVMLALGLPACGKDSPVAPSPLAATCSASPASGPTPLPVAFALNVTGAQGSFALAINYGDGATGVDPAARHVYAAAGSYAATFAVTTATQSALCTASVRVDPPPAPSPAPAPAANRIPEAVFSTNPVAGPGDTFTGKPPLTITFNMCRTSDPDGDPLNFTMDFEGDGKIDSEGTTGADCRHEHAYTLVGTSTPRICVTDLLPSRAPAHPYQCKVYVVKLTK
jgi:PKD repeat protein